MYAFCQTSMIKGEWVMNLSFSTTVTYGSLSHHSRYHQVQAPPAY